MDKDAMQNLAGYAGQSSAMQNMYAKVQEAPTSLVSITGLAEENLKRLSEAARKAYEIAEHLRPSNTVGGAKGSDGGPIDGAIGALDEQQRRSRSILGDLFDALARIDMALGRLN